MQCEEHSVKSSEWWRGNKYCSECRCHITKKHIWYCIECGHLLCDTCQLEYIDHEFIGMFEDSSWCTKYQTREEDEDYKIF